MKKSFVIAGAGFKGFCDAVELLKNPDNKVYILDPAPFLGGLMYSLDVKGFSVDKGVHVFDSIPVALAEIVNEIMDGKTKPIDFVSESAFGGVVTQGYSLPDLSSLERETKARISLELIELAAQDQSQRVDNNLRDVFVNRYGETAGGIFSSIFNNIYGIDPKALEPGAIAQTSLGRMKFLDDHEMMVLKKHPWLDTVLAARRKAVGKVDDYVSIYPDTKDAMKGWCTRAVGWLESKGAILGLGEKILSLKDGNGKIEITTDKRTISADHLIWSNDNFAYLSQLTGLKDSVTALQHTTALVFMTLITKAKDIKDFTYLQNFDPKALTYRSAALGIVSDQIDAQGRSFITCECPTLVGTEKWNNADSLVEDVWKECKDLKVVDASSELLDSNVIKIPVTFKMPKIGFFDQVAAFSEQLSGYSNRLLLRNVRPFYRREIYLDSLGLSNLLS